MAILYNIDYANRCLFFRLEGLIKSGDVWSFLCLFWRDQRYTEVLRYDRLIDASKVFKVSMESGFIRKVALEDLRLIKGRTALVSGSELTYALFRMYQMYAEGLACELFRNTDEALQWLGKIAPPRERFVVFPDSQSAGT